MNIITIKFQGATKDRNFLITNISDSRTTPGDFTFRYVDDINFLCDMAELDINIGFDLLAKLLPLSGTEKVNITFGHLEGSEKQKLKEKISVEMDIFCIHEKTSNPGSNYKSMKFILVNKALSKLVGDVKNRSFQDTYSNIALRIANEVEDFDKKIIEETIGKKSVMQTYWSDAQLLKNISSSARSSSGSSPFIVHISGKEFHFHSFAYKYPENQCREDIYSYVDKKVLEKDELHLIVMDAKYITRNKAYLLTGGAGSSTGGFDFQKGYIIKNKRGDEVLKETKPVEEKMRKMPARIDEISVAKRFSYAGLQDLDEVETILKNDIASSLQSMLEIHVLIRGRAYRKCGKIIDFKTLQIPGHPDKRFDGKYFIKSVIHAWQNGEYYNKLVLIRPGFLEGPISELVSI